MPTVRPSEALAAHRSEIADAIARHGGQGCFVVGSVARGEDDEHSDLDLMVTLPVAADLVAVGDLIDELERITGVRVDLLSGRSAGPIADTCRRDAIPL